MEVAMSERYPIDVIVDLNTTHETGLPWAFLDEAPHPNGLSVAPTWWPGQDTRVRLHWWWTLTAASCMFSRSVAWSPATHRCSSDTHSRPDASGGTANQRSDAPEAQAAATCRSDTLDDHPPRAGR